METKPPLPPFTQETAAQKVRMAEDVWNTRDPDRVVLAYTEDTRWRNRSEFPVGREQVRQFLVRKWAKELDYRLIKELWACSGNRIAVRFAYEWHDDSGNWYRSYGNVLAGLVGFRFLPLSALPQVDYPTIQVQTLYPGASPEVMAHTVTGPLENQLGQMSGLTRMGS